MNKPLADAIAEQEIIELSCYARKGHSVEDKQDILDACRACFLLAAARAQVPRRATEAMHSVAFNYAEGMDGDVTAQDLLIVFYEILDASPINALHDTED